MSRFNAKQIHVLYVCFLNRNPISSLLSVTQSQAHDMFSRNVDRIKKWFCRRSVHVHMGVCVHICTLSMYFTIYIFQCTSRGNIVSNAIECMTINLTLHLMHNNIVLNLWSWKLTIIVENLDRVCFDREWHRIRND